MNITALIDRLRLGLGNRDDIEGNLAQFINEALIEINRANVEHFPLCQKEGTLTTDSGTDEYAFTDILDAGGNGVTDFLYPLMLWYTGPSSWGTIRVHIMNKERFELLEDDNIPSDLSGYPLRVSLFGGKLTFFPAVTQAVDITIPYFASLPYYTASSSEDDLLRDAYDILLWGAKWKGWDALGNPTVADGAERHFWAALKRFKRSHRARALKGQKLTMGSLSDPHATEFE
jgi:hypothetical protein